MDRIPAFPLIANDPYFSLWLPADKPTEANTVHWSGVRKWMRGHITVDGRRYRFLGKNGVTPAETLDVRITPTQTVFEVKAGSVKLTVRFWSPALPEDMDLLSTPITFVDFAAVALDDDVHNVQMCLSVPDALCFDGENPPSVFKDGFVSNGLNLCYMGRSHQNILCHAGDRLTIDWGYLYIAAREHIVLNECGADVIWNTDVSRTEKRTAVLLGYDDVASINYFGVPCRAWYARNGRTLREALEDFELRHDELLKRCKAMDERVLSDARAVGGDDYALIAAASWRHVFGAHKLIATPNGEPALLSKECDSNGCIGTVDLSYPSSPIFVKYNPELVNALCRPIMEFASMPVWEYDFAPHDVGRYPYATGQIYDLVSEPRQGEVLPPYYMYPAGAGIYSGRNQMPVEESGNMLVMLAAALDAGADVALAERYLALLAKWVRYLDEFGEDPCEQLCTDDFAGHLAHNVNLSAKAIVGIACYARILAYVHKTDEAQRWTKRAHEMAQNWLKNVERSEAGTPLTFGGEGWSMKYNLAWDVALGLRLMPDDFYASETRSYLGRMNDYGLPLDSRADYTKSDWLMWCAAMARDAEVRSALIAPLARMLRTTRTRVPFSDWYDTHTGDYVEFIARSVQGGVFMPMLTIERQI